MGFMGYSCPDEYPPLVRRGGGDGGAESRSQRMHVLYYFSSIIHQNIKNKCHSSVAESYGGRGKSS